MATLGQVTIPVNYQMTEVSKQLIKSLIAETLADVLADSPAIFTSIDELRAFVREEVKKSLSEDELRQMVRRLVHEELHGLVEEEVNRQLMRAAQHIRTARGVMEFK